MYKIIFLKYKCPQHPFTAKFKTLNFAPNEPNVSPDEICNLSYYTTVVYCYSL